MNVQYAINNGIEIKNVFDYEIEPRTQKEVVDNKIKVLEEIQGLLNEYDQRKEKRNNKKENK